MKKVRLFYKGVLKMSNIEGEKGVIIHNGGLKQHFCKYPI